MVYSELNKNPNLIFRHSAPLHLLHGYSDSAPEKPWGSQYTPWMYLPLFFLLECISLWEMPSHPSGPSSNVPSSVLCPEIPAEIFAPSVSVLKFYPYLVYKIYHIALVSVSEIFEKSDFILLIYLCISPSSSPAILPLTFILVTYMLKTLYPNPYNQMSFGIQNFQHLEWY